MTRADILTNKNVDAACRETASTSRLQRFLQKKKKKGISRGMY